MRVRITWRRRERHSLLTSAASWVTALAIVTVAFSVRADEREVGPTTAVPSTVASGQKTAPTSSDKSATDPGAAPAAEVRIHSAMKPNLTPISHRASGATSDGAEIQRAIRAIALCQARFESVDDYTCTFFKRERIDGRMTPLHVMTMKARTKPQSIYFKFQRPANGREAIYIAGRHDGKVLAHDVGLNKLFAGTLELEPTSSRAMEDCRHPITEAGIGALLDTVAKRWAAELNPDHSKLVFRDDMVVGGRRCTMIESTHPTRRREFMHYRVRVFIDSELGLPIRFEAYDWPKRAQGEPELIEEYSYLNLKLNVGLRDIDFDASNSEYSFGRF